MVERLIPYFPYDPTPYPENPSDKIGWDRFWSAILLDAENTHSGATSLLNWRRGPVSQSTFDLKTRIPDLKALGARRILFAANGVRIVPEFFRHYGFDVTAMDFSDVAVQYASSHPAENEDWDASFSVAKRIGSMISPISSEGITDQEITQANIRSTFIPGGSLTYRVGDVRSLERDESWDTIAVLNLLLLYPPEPRQLLIQTLFAALRPGGILIVQEGGWGDLSPQEDRLFNEQLEKAGFVTEYAELRRWMELCSTKELRRRNPVAWGQELGERGHGSREVAYQTAKEGRKILITS